MQISDLFEFRYGHSLALNKLRRAQAGEGVNFVGRAMGGNGVTARVESVVGIAPAQAGELSVALGGAGVLFTFIQPEPFYCGRDVGILTAKDPSMSDVEKIWWARAIHANRYRFSYGRQANRSLMNLELPDVIPPWVQDAAIPDITDLDDVIDAPKAAAGSPVAIPALGTWKKFSLGSLFDIKKGSRLTKREMVPGPTPYIGASDRNNGRTAYISGKPMFPGHTITVPYNGSVAHAFYQPEPYSAGDDVHALIPREDVSVGALLFVCTVIRHEKFRFSYGRKWNLERMVSSGISLPALGDKPDWDTMTAYTAGLPFSALPLETQGAEAERVDA